MRTKIVLIFSILAIMPVIAKDAVGKPIKCIGKTRLKTSQLMGKKSVASRPLEEDDTENNLERLPQCSYENRLLKHKKANPKSPIAWQVPQTNTNRCTITPNPAPTVQQIDLQFTAITSTNAPQAVLFNPPDTMGAVGTKQFITCINEGARSFDKQTGIEDQAMDITMDGFWNEATSDPRLKFDIFTNRWFITMVSIPLGAAESDIDHPEEDDDDENDRIVRQGVNNMILIAFSDSDVITKCTEWTVFKFPQDEIQPAGDIGLLADYDATGIDQHALYIGADMFDASGNFINATAYVFQKSSLLTASTEADVVATAFRNLTPGGNGPFKPHGVDNFDPNPEFGYIVGMDNNQLGTMDVYRIINPGSTTPTISPLIQVTIPLDSFLNTLGLPHKGNLFPQFGLISYEPTTVNCSPHIRNGQLYVTEDTGVNKDGVVPAFLDPSLDRMAVRFFQFDMAPGGTETPTTMPDMIQCGQIWDSTNTPTPRSYWFGSLMTNKRNDLIVGCSTTSEVDYINAAYAGRLGTDPLGTIGAPIIYTNSQAAYMFAESSSIGAQRWGDYTNTSLDPSDQLTIWTIQQWTKHFCIWGLEVARIPAP